MNEQDMMIKKKIEKREKVDIVLAYILIAILLLCILFILYLKFIRKDELDVPQDEYVPNYITLEQISSDFNASPLVSELTIDGSTINSNANDNGLNINYDGELGNFNFAFVREGNELVLNWTVEDSDLVKRIYNEIATSICVYYGNSDELCRNTLDTMGEDGVSGIRFSNEDDTNSVYLDINKGITVNSMITYKEVTKVEVGKTSYELSLSGTRISDIKTETTDNSLALSGTITRTDDSSDDLSVVVKLYNTVDEVIGENKVDFNSENSLDGSKTFEVTFDFTDDLTLEEINKYSIEVVK